MSAIEKLIEETGEDTLINGLVELEGEDVALLMYEHCAWINFYIEVKDYTDLKDELLADDVLWSDCDIAQDDFYQFLDKNENEDSLKIFLNKHGWIITKNQLAICFDA